MKPHSQKGLSLVELMIAMTLAVVLTTAVVNIFISSKNTYSVLNGQASMQENGRFALDFIRQELQKAGYRTYAYPVLSHNNQTILDQNNNPLTKASNANFVALEETFPPRGEFAAGQVIVGGPNSDGNAVPGSDFIAVRYQRSDDGTSFDCLGAVIPRRADNEIRIVTTRFYVSTNHELMCQVRMDDGDAQAPVALVSGVENLQVRFGVGRESHIDHYASSIAANDKVYAVEFALLASSDQQTSNRANGTQYRLLDQNIEPAQDQKLRQVFSQTVRLRNVPSYAMNATR